MRIVKIIGFILLGLILSLFIAAGLFLYKIGDGFDSFEKVPPEIRISESTNAILVFSKTNGFRHTEAIEASIPMYDSLSKVNGWQIFVTENAAIFNDEQLILFDVVIWNNATGRNLTEEQRGAFKRFIERGGGFVGVHGAGDFSHSWDWYEDEVICAHFSHHNLDTQPVSSVLSMEKDTSYSEIYSGLKEQLNHADEWYVFSDNPREKGVNVLYTVDESLFDPSGNLGFLVTDKGFGMGDDHPIVWYHELGESRVFYSALGHHAGVFQDANMNRMLENAIRWAGRFDSSE